MRRVANVRDEVRATFSDTATEHVERTTSSDNNRELTLEEVSLCYRLFGRRLLTYDLLPHQKKQKKYQLQNNYPGDTSLKSRQRSLINVLLRKNLGVSKIAFLIWQHGMPSIVDAPLVRGQRVDQKEHYVGLLQSGLQECLQWFTCLANEIVVYKSQEGFDAQLSASSLSKQDRQLHETRQESLLKAQNDSKLGAALARQRDDGKRSYEDMNEDEKQVLEDFETGKTAKARKKFAAPKIGPFRCKLKSSATEHAT